MSQYKPLSPLGKLVLEEAKRFPVVISSERQVRFPYPDTPEAIRTAKPAQVVQALVELKEQGEVIMRMTAEFDFLFYAPDPKLIEVFGVDQHLPVQALWQVTR